MARSGPDGPWPLPHKSGGRLTRRCHTGQVMILLYIDPGAGSMLIQAVLAGLLAVPFFFRTQVSRLLHKLRGRGEEYEDRY